MATGNAAKEQPKPAPFYRFTDASGRVHIVDSLDLVPQAFRAQVEGVHYEEQTPVNGLPSVASLASWQIFALGVAATLVVMFVFKRLPGSGRIVVRLGLIGLVVAVVGAAYFGFLRRTTQQSGAAFASPSALIDDAKGAVEKMNARLKAQQAELKEIEQGK